MHTLNLLLDEKSAFNAHYQQKICCITDQSEVLATTAQLDREREAMINKHQEALKQFDIGVILQLDQEVSEQQVTFYGRVDVRNPDFTLSRFQHLARAFLIAVSNP